MIDTVALLDPDGNAVYASKVGADELRLEHGYTDVPPAVEIIDVVDDPDPAPGHDPDPSPDPDPDGEPAVKDPAAPRGNASRADWAAYAEQLGLPVGADDSRNDIKAALADLEQ